MDFFAAEGRAKKKTSRLLTLFGLAVAGTVVAGYFLAIIALRLGQARHAYRYNADPGDFVLWQPGVFAVVTLVTLAVIALASLYKWTEFRGGGAAVAEECRRPPGRPAHDRPARAAAPERRRGDGDRRGPARPGRVHPGRGGGHQCLCRRPHPQRCRCHRDAGHAGEALPRRAAGRRRP